MKKLGLSLLSIMIALSITGCGSNSPTIPKIKATEKFQFSNAKLNLSQLVKTEIIYHTQRELEDILNAKLSKLLDNDGLLSDNNNMNKLIVNANYERRFVGDATPIPTDSLAYPNYSYSIKIMNNKKLLGTINKDKLTFRGGFVMNLEIIAGTLRDKKYELEFIDALANTIFKDIKNLN
ncbi:hypothetical protein [Sulfurimonas sp.]|uniref:hypothetical protein n=1 Tax=Sulfurimonas sp. TaxID=2022749 RepID=UPI002B4A761E|nr:hypothetical protein [Sulfurimonas sp.]